jgi:hypothetical protein
MKEGLGDRVLKYLKGLIPLIDGSQEGECLYW